MATRPMTTLHTPAFVLNLVVGGDHLDPVTSDVFDIIKIWNQSYNDMICKIFAFDYCVTTILEIRLVLGSRSFTIEDMQAIVTWLSPKLSTTSTVSTRATTLTSCIVEVSANGIKTHDALQAFELLSTGILASPSSQIRVLNFQGSGAMGQIGMTLITSVIMHPTTQALQVLNLHNCGLDAPALKLLRNFFQESRKHHTCVLEELILSGNNMGSSSAQYVKEILKGSRNLRKFVSGQNPQRQGSKNLVHGLYSLMIRNNPCMSMEFLDLREVIFGGGGDDTIVLQSFCEILEAMPHLTTLKLSNCGLQTQEMERWITTMIRRQSLYQSDHHHQFHHSQSNHNPIILQRMEELVLEDLGDDKLGNYRGRQLACWWAPLNRHIWSALETLSLEGNGLGWEGLSHLIPCFNFTLKSLKNINLARNNLGREGAQLLLGVSQDPQNWWNSLDLQANKLEDIILQHSLQGHFHHTVVIFAKSTRERRELNKGKLDDQHGDDLYGEANNFPQIPISPISLPVTMTTLTATNPLIVLEVGGERLDPLISEIGGILNRWSFQYENAIKNQVLLANSFLEIRLVLKKRSWSVQTMEAIIPWFRQILTTTTTVTSHVVEVLAEDIIAGQETDVGLQVLHLLSHQILASSRPYIRVLQFENNAMGPRNMRHITNIISSPALVVLNLDNCGMDAESMKLLANALLLVEKEETKEKQDIQEEDQHNRKESTMTATSGSSYHRRYPCLLEELILSRNNIQEHGAKYVGQILQSCPFLRKFVYSGTRPGRVGSEFILRHGLYPLLQSLQVHTTHDKTTATMTTTRCMPMQFLDLREVTFGGDSSSGEGPSIMQCLCEILAAMPCLETLQLSDCGVKRREMGHWITTMIQHQSLYQSDHHHQLHHSQSNHNPIILHCMKKLVLEDLCDDNLGNYGGKQLARWLAPLNCDLWSSLKTLSLEGNGLGWKGLRHLMPCFNNTLKSLESVNLARNYLGRKAAHILLSDINYPNRWSVLHLEENLLKNKDLQTRLALNFERAKVEFGDDQIDDDDKDDEYDDDDIVDSDDEDNDEDDVEGTF